MFVYHILSFLVLCLSIEVFFFIDKLEKLQSANDSLTSCKISGGKWTDWGEWSSCSTSCGGGMRSRTRTCIGQIESSVGKQCDGDSKQDEPCSINKRCLISVFSVSGPRSVSSPETEYILQRYSTVNMNEGGDFDPVSGKFTCTKPGIYYFTATLIKQRADEKVDLVHCQIYKNSSPQIRLFVDPTDDDTDIGHAAVTNSIVLRLDRGDIVYLGWCDDPSTTIEEWSSFTGFLLYPDF